MPSVIQFLCDVCFADDVETVGESHTVNINRHERSIILCKAHEAEILEPLRVAVMELGSSPIPSAKQPTIADARKEKSKRLPEGMTKDEALDLLDANACLFTPTHGTFASRAGAVAHLRNVHGVRVDELGLSLRGTAMAATAAANRAGVSAAGENAEPSREWPCGEPGCDRVFDRPQGAGAHRRAVHGIVGPTSVAGKGPGRPESRSVAVSGPSRAGSEPEPLAL